VKAWGRSGNHGWHARLTARQPATRRSLTRRCPPLPPPRPPLAGASVALSGNADWGLTWDVTFPPSPGDAPPLRVVSVDATNGSSVQAAVTTQCDGDGARMLAPIPADWLRTPAAAPGAVAAEAGGALAACGAGGGGAGCQFAYSWAATPTITSVAPTTFGLDDTDVVGGRRRSGPASGVGGELRAARPRAILARWLNHLMGFKPRSARAAPSKHFCVLRAPRAHRHSPQELVVDGRGLSLNASDNEIALEGVECTNATAAPAGGPDPGLVRLRCRLDARAVPAGRRQLRVAVRGLGAAVSDGAAAVAAVNGSAWAPAWDIGLVLTFSTLSITSLGLPARNDSSPPTLNDGGASLFEIRGTGFDVSDCGANLVTINGTACGVAECSPGRLLVLWPGGELAGTNATAENATVDVRVRAPLRTGRRWAAHVRPWLQPRPLRHRPAPPIPPGLPRWSPRTAPLLRCPPTRAPQTAPWCCWLAAPASTPCCSPAHHDFLSRVRWLALGGCNMFLDWGGRSIHFRECNTAPLSAPPAQLRQPRSPPERRRRCPLHSWRGAQRIERFFLEHFPASWPPRRRPGRLGPLGRRGRAGRRARGRRALRRPDGRQLKRNICVGGMQRRPTLVVTR
jgi:hypothetical protein